MRALWVLLTICGFAVGGAAQQQTSESIRRVHGVVVNAVSQAPISRALVTTGDQRMAQLTDSEGRFEFEVKVLNAGQMPGVGGHMQSGAGGFRSLGNASVYLMARKPGYRPSERATELLLTDAASLEGTVRVPLMPEAVIAGHIATDKAVPPVGVQVQLMQRRVEDGRGVWRATLFQQTNVWGEYRFADLAAGDYKIVTREWTERGVGARGGDEPKVGYPPVGYPNGTNLGTAALVHVAAGETVQADMVLQPMPYYPVQIPVANASGMGLGVQVEDGGGGSGFSLGYDGRRQTVTGSLPAGSYKVLLTAYGERPMMASANLTVAGPVNGGGLTLTPGAAMRVEVREELTAPSEKNRGVQQVSNGIGAVNGQPVPRSVEVYLQPIDGEQRPGASLRNARQGKVASTDLVVENLQPGSYWVRVQPHRGYVASATVNGLDVLRNPLVVVPGSGVPPLQVTLRDDFAALTGTLTKMGSAGVSATGEYTMVWCFPLGDGAVEPAQSFVDPRAGRFENAMMPPGRYLVIASDSQQMGNLTWREEDTVKRLMAKGTEVTLPPGGAASVTLTPTSGDLE